MVNKNNLPKISLNVLSAIAVIASFVFIFTTLRHFDGTFVQHLIFMISLAVISSIVLIFLIRMGAKVDNKLANIQVKDKRVLYTLLVYIAIPVFCAVTVGILYLLSLTGFMETSAGRDFGFVLGLFGILIFFPLVFGTTFIYLGAIVSALSRWAAGLIWRENETGN